MAQYEDHLVDNPDIRTLECHPDDISQDSSLYKDHNIMIIFSESENHDDDSKDFQILE